ncbi:hypothetical protein THAOC_31056 [Thalassiosira oceanica]|uniref:Nudix hydrolase domain-containing protein n=1 Tax=Thalassiosira oceanica TaxID=159749 RepID=K0R8X5_THAOC|nr:hypothetical protein THAOC_31056 [Thalassiosira oceanica]|eukprot:EJK50018.1 hypothetical protein THAOC_31056 [Thalassiosira oceanica]
MNGAGIVFLLLMAAVNNATPFAFEPEGCQCISSSLASSFAVKIDKIDFDSLRWDLYPLSAWEKEGDEGGVGSIAIRGLTHDWAREKTGVGTACSLDCHWAQQSSSDDWSVSVSVDGAGEGISTELVCVLSRVIAQSAAARIAKYSTSSEKRRNADLLMTLPMLEGQGCQRIKLSDLREEDGIRLLFDPLGPDHSTVELVDMVCSDGQVLGSVPRNLVHKYNLLHRGIGMIISKDDNIFETFRTGRLPQVYCHQRTDTKRVFPSLYDMFVGGVSASFERSRLTAAREVAEELGMKRALNLMEEGLDDESPLSQELFQCTIATSYNRCVVSFFTYTCDTSVESLAWQEEEVQWGQFVPYDIVEESADLSIERLVNDGAWPGEKVILDYEPTIMSLKERYSEEKYEGWERWDYVPDGLLVWQAWKKYLERRL